MSARKRPLSLALAVLAAATPLALAHEEGVIHLDAETVPVGGEIGIQGAKLPVETRLKLELRGALETFPLAEVRTDASGEFRTRIALPLEAGTGRYTVVAVAPDGDDVAEAEIVVVPPSAGDTLTLGPGAPLREPTAEAMELPAARTAPEWLAIVLFVALCAGGGVALLAGRRNGRPG